ncbi:MAG: phytanoyl-CoA dioxygenase family protein [Acidimicrobiales bacterium]
MHHLTDTERDELERDGFVVREGVFGPSEVDAMIEASEALVAGLVEGRHGRRWTVGSYTFEPDMLSLVMLKWEGDSDQLHGIEPVAHLSADLEAWGLDPRLVDPMVAFVGDEHPVLYTEKLNLKRPFVGGPNPLHQDYPYWIDGAFDAARTATAIVYLDETTLENGCLEVVPGSHRSGRLPTRSDMDVFGANEMDPVANADLERVSLPLSAGSVVLFGAFLAHATGPNRTDTHRRALLYSYQPAAGHHMLDELRRTLQPSSS